jgi:hypothetical protein
VPPLRGSGLGGDFTPRFRFASPGVTHGATSTRLGVALRSFWPSGRRLEVFLHAIRLFRLNSQKNDRPNRESACNPIPTNNNHRQKFPCIPRVQWLQKQPYKKSVFICVHPWLKIGCGRLVHPKLSMTFDSVSRPGTQSINRCLT